MKPFDLSAAKAGKPVCTRDGRAARIVCFDRKGEQPIIALVPDGDDEMPEHYHLTGKWMVWGGESGYDLFMADSFNVEVLALGHGQINPN